MAEQAETGHVGDRVHPVDAGQLLPEPVELGGGGDHCPVTGIVELALFQRRAAHADAERLGQDEQVARLCTGVAQHAAGMDEAERHQPVDRFGAVDGVPAGDRDAGFGADGGAARDDRLHALHSDPAQWHAEDRQREDRRAAHGVNVRERVGGGDATELERIVDDRREEVGRGDQGLLVVQPPDRRVIPSLEPDQEVGEGAGLRHAGQDLLQHGGRQLAAAAAAMGQLG